MIPILGQPTKNPSVDSTIGTQNTPKDVPASSTEYYTSKAISVKFDQFDTVAETTPILNVSHDFIKGKGYILSYTVTMPE